MKDVYIISSTINKGGASHCAVVLSENIHEPEITLFSIIPDVEFASTQARDVVQLSSSKSTSFLKRCFTYVCSLIRYTLRLNSEKPILSMSINSLSHIVNIMACSLTSTKCVIAVHDNPNYCSNFQERLVKSIPIIFARFLKINIITVSEGLKIILSDDFHVLEKNISVFYNPTELEDISNKSLEVVEEEFFQDDVPIIISVGNVIPVKGQWHLLRIFDRLCKITPCKLVICGDTNRNKSYMQYLSSIYENMGCKDNVLFTGWTPNPYKYLRKSTVFALSSMSESWGYCLIEALACGVPIVSTDCISGPTEILEKGKYGLLSKPLDNIQSDLDVPLTPAENDMMEKILYLLKNPDIRQDFARKGIERAKDFDKEITIKKYIQYFESTN